MYPRRSSAGDCSWHCEGLQEAFELEQPGDEPHDGDQPKCHQHIGALDQPRREVALGQQVIEALRLFQVADEQAARNSQEHDGHDRRHDPDRGLGVGIAEQDLERGDQHRTACNGLGDEVARHHLAPRGLVAHGVRGSGYNAVEFGWLLAERDRNARMVGRGVRPDHAVVGDRGSGGIERGLVGPLVEDLGLRVLLWRTNSHIVAADHLADLRRWVVEISDDDRLGGAHDLTRRFEILLQPVVTHVALVCGVGLRVDVEGVVGARIHARLAANAVVVLEVDHTIVGTKERICRTDRHARRIVALVAAHHIELARYIGEGAGLDVLDPRPVDPERHVVLALTRNGARMAPNAVVTVEKKAETRHPSIVSADTIP